MKGETAYKILEWERNETLDGEEYKAVIERVRSDGGKALQRIFTRKVDTGSSYTVFTHLAFGEGGMSQTIIVSG